MTAASLSASQASAHVHLTFHLVLFHRCLDECESSFFRPAADCSSLRVEPSLLKFGQPVGIVLPLCILSASVSVAEAKN